MRCPCHGSRYDLEGRVFRNANGGSTEPPPFDLKRFDNEFDETAGIVAISIPGLLLAVRSLTVYRRDPSGNTRLKLEFPVAAGASYEVRHHMSLDGYFTVVPLALTSTGAAHQRSESQATSGNVIAYVDTRGFKGFPVVDLRLTPHQNQCSQKSWSYACFSIYLRFFIMVSALNGQFPEKPEVFALPNP